MRTRYRLLRDTLGQRVKRMLPPPTKEELKAERAIREGCIDCPRDDVKPVFKDTVRCKEHYEAHRLANATGRRKKGAPARLLCPCGVAGHFDRNCPTGGVAEGVAS